MVAGRRVEAGAIVTVPAAQAADALDSGDKFELLDPSDLPAVQAGRRAEVLAAVRQAGRIMPPPADGPWFPIQ
jgi:hypothetical protein